MSNTLLSIFNTSYDQNISLDTGAGGLPPLTIRGRQTLEVDLIPYQWDRKFLSELVAYMSKGALQLTYQGTVLTVDQIQKVQDVGLVALSTSQSFEIAFQNLTDGPGSFENHALHFVVVNKDEKSLGYLSVDQAFSQIPVKAYSVLLASMKRDLMPVKDRMNDLAKQIQDQKQEILLLVQQRSVLKSWVVIGWVVALGAAALSIWSIL
jgi:hypothetical protein